MKTTMQLLEEVLEEVMEIGFDKEYALDQIDAGLDDEFGFDNRKYLNEEELSDELYGNFIQGFKAQAEEK